MGMSKKRDDIVKRWYEQISLLFILFYLSGADKRQEKTEFLGFPFLGENPIPFDPDLQH